MDKKNAINPFGLVLMIVGVGLSVALGVTKGAAFVGAGLPLALIGLLMLRKGRQADAGGGEPR